MSGERPPAGYLHLVGDEDDQPACDFEGPGFLTHNPARATCPACLAAAGEQS